VAATLVSLAGAGAAVILAPATVAAQPSPAAEADTSCDPKDPTAEAVVDARMGWGVRESFRSYVTSRASPTGAGRLGGGAVFSDGEFVFDGGGRRGVVLGGDGDAEVAADAALVVRRFRELHRARRCPRHLTVSDPEIRDLRRRRDPRGRRHLE
jgi:hypothetical protein